jgi:hypothetical protein
MTYIVRIDRPLIDDKTKDIEVADKEAAAIAVVDFIRISQALEENFKVLSMEKTETELKVTLSSGTMRAFPKGAH